jgi:hypothetical protein
MSLYITRSCKGISKECWSGCLLYGDEQQCTPILSTRSGKKLSQVLKTVALGKKSDQHIQVEQKRSVIPDTYISKMEADMSSTHLKRVGNFGRVRYWYLLHEGRAFVTYQKKASRK